MKIEAETMTGQTEDISVILTQKLKAYDEFQFVTGLLQKAIDGDDMTMTNKLVDRREELIQAIDRLDCRINHHRDSIPGREGPTVVRRMATISEVLGEKLEEIMIANRGCITTVANRCEAVRKELTVIRHNEKGLQGYALKMQRIPKFLNVQT
jgi:hypothetical protein